MSLASKMMKAGILLLTAVMPILPGLREYTLSEEMTNVLREAKEEWVGNRTAAIMGSVEK